LEPEDPPEIALLVAILKLATVINRPMRDGVADPEGLSLNELRVMMSLGGEGPMAGHELAELIGMQPMNVSRSLANLAARGWVEQTGGAGNRRRKPYRLSTGGWAAHRAMLPEVADVASFLFSGLPKGESQRLADLAQALIGRIGEWQPPAKLRHVSRA
jgi:DNA-binding MarR family transcriptional regulator